MSSSGDNNKTVLIVEDEEPIRRLLSRHLESENYTVVSTGSGTDALAWCEQNGLPDLVVSDVLMPTMSGPELYDRLRTSYGDVCFLFMTGHAGDNFYHHREEVPVLGKPFNRTDFLTAVKEALE